MLVYLTQEFLRQLHIKKTLGSIHRKLWADINKYKKFATLAYKKHAGIIEDAWIQETCWDHLSWTKKYRLFLDKDLRDASIMCGREKQLSVLRILMFNFNKQQRSKIARAYFGYNNFRSPSLPYTSKISKLKPHLSQLNLKRAFNFFFPLVHIDD